MTSIFKMALGNMFKKESAGDTLFECNSLIQQIHDHMDPECKADTTRRLAKVIHTNFMAFITSAPEEIKEDLKNLLDCPASAIHALTMESM
jgi:hypothetical protein